MACTRWGLLYHAFAWNKTLWTSLDQVRQGVIDRMSAAANLDVELLVETGAGKDWDSAH